MSGLQSGGGLNSDVQADFRTVRHSLDLAVEHRVRHEVEKTLDSYNLPSDLEGGSPIGGGGNPISLLGAFVVAFISQLLSL